MRSAAVSTSRCTIRESGLIMPRASVQRGRRPLRPEAQAVAGLTPRPPEGVVAVDRPENSRHSIETEFPPDDVAPPLRPFCGCRSRIRESRLIARAQSDAPGSTSSPVDSCSTSSGMPDNDEATTGSPAAIASMSATGIPPSGRRTRRCWAARTATPVRIIAATRAVGARRQGSRSLQSGIVGAGVRGRVASALPDDRARELDTRSRRSQVARIKSTGMPL